MEVLVRPVTDYWSFANRLVTVSGVTVTDDNYGSCDDCVPAVLDVLIQMLITTIHQLILMMVLVLTVLHLH